MTEIWKDIEEYEDYQVSNMGRVKSLGNDKTRKEKILKPTKNGGGYLQVGLCRQGKRKHHKVHRLVAQAFIPNPNNYPQLNHIDENKTNNRVDNLEYCDRKYNVNYGTAQERRVANTDYKAIAAKKSKSVLCVETGVVYPSIQQVERELGFDQGHICKCCNGKRKTCGGYHWRYVS